MAADETLDERILELLAHWEEQRQIGKTPSAEELCPNDATLRDELRLRIQRRERMHGILEPAALHEGAQQSPAIHVPTAPHDYELLGVVGHGGMGIVYKARHKLLNRLVALKMFPPGSPVGLEDHARFRAEAEVVAQIHHPHVVQIYEVGVQAGCPYLALEFVAGGSLAQRLAGTPMPFRQAAELVQTLARAVHHAHQQNVIHRDLKPANVLLTMDGTPKVTDFGLAKRLDSDRGYTQTGAVLGTPSYMAPEQAEGRNREVGPAADIYALGAILYELLTSRPPFCGVSTLDTLEQVRTQEPVPPRQLQPSLPRDLETICLKCLRKEPPRRYATAAALADDLGRLLAGKPIQARPVGELERVWRWCRRKPKLAALTAAVAALALVVAIGAPIALVSMQNDRNLALGAARDAEAALWHSYLSEASALRRSGQVGQRFLSLDRLQRAAQLRPSPELRDHAIASLALTDVRVAGATWQGNPGDDAGVEFDAALERYARWEDASAISVRRVADDIQIARLTLPGWLGLTWYLGFSPDARFLAALYVGKAQKGEYVVWDVDRQQVVLRVPGELAVAPLAFSPDSRLLAAAWPGGGVRVYELPSGKESKRIDDKLEVTSLAFHPNGRLLAVASFVAQVLEVRNLDTGNVAAQLPDPGPVHALAWNADGALLASSSEANVLLWDVAAERRLASLRGHQQRVVFLAFSRPGDLLISAGWDSTTLLWDPRTGRSLLRMLGNAIRLGSDDRRLAFRDRTSVGLWELAHGDAWRLLLPRTVFANLDDPLHFPKSVDVSPRGDLFVTADGHGVRLWDAALGRELEQHSGGRTSAAFFHPRRDTLITHGDDGLCRRPFEIITDGKAAARQVRWGRADVLKPAPEPSFFPHHFAACTPDGRWLLANEAWQPRAFLLDLNDPTEELALSVPAAGRFLALSPDAQWVATGAGRAGVIVHARLTGKKAAELPGRSNALVGFSPDGQWLVTGDQVEHRCWRTGSWDAGWTFPRQRSESSPGPLAFSPDSRLLAVASTLDVVQIRDLTSGELVATLRSPNPHAIRALCFTPDGAKLLVATEHPALQVWDLAYLREQLASMKMARHSSD